MQVCTFALFELIAIISKFARLLKLRFLSSHSPSFRVIVDLVSGLILLRKVLLLLVGLVAILSGVNEVAFYSLFTHSLQKEAAD